LPYTLKAFNIQPAILEGRRNKNDYTFFSKHFHTAYNFLSSSMPKPHNRWQKAFAIKVIGILK